MNRINKFLSFLISAATRKYWVAVCFVLAILGQSLIREPQPFSLFKLLTKAINSLNNKFYLTLKNPVNIMLGLLLIAFSSLIYSRLSRLNNASKNTQELVINDTNWPSLKRLLPWGIVNLGIYILIMTQLARHQYSNLLLWGWLGTIFIFTILIWKSEKKTQLNSNSSITNIDGIWILALFAFAVTSGSYLLNDLPAGWVIDEGPFWVMARSIAIGETHPPFFDFGVFSFPIGSSLLQGWIMRWAGINMWGWRFASVLPAAITVIPLYLLTHELFDRRTAITANVLMIANPYFLTFSRFGYNNSQSLFPVTLCIYFLVMGIRKNSRLYLWLAGLTAGLGFYTYFAAWLGLAILVVVVIGLPLTYGIKFQRKIVSLAIILAGAFVVFLPRMLYGMSGETPILLHLKIWETIPINVFYGQSVFGIDRMAHTAQTENFLAGDKLELFYNLSLYGIILLRGIILSTAVLFDPIVNLDHHIIYGLTGPGSSIFFILGLGITFANFKDIRYRIPLIWFLAGFFLLGALTSFPPRPTHMVPMIPVLSLISAIGLISFLDILLGINPGKIKSGLSLKKMVAPSTLFVIVIISFFQFFFLTLYIYFPPNTDEYISWLGRQISQPANIFLVDHHFATLNPFDEWLIKLGKHPILYLTRANLESNPSQMREWKNFVTFIDLADGREYAEWIAQNIPEVKVQAAYAPGRRLRGYVVTDMKINTSMDISLSHGVKDLWNSPTRNILLLCGMGIIALFIKKKRANGQTSNKIGDTI